MPRPPRIHVEGALHLVSSRALPGLQLFRDEQDYAAYLELLKGYQAQYGFILSAFVLLPDRLSLCIELTNDATISEIMHALNSRHTKRYNKRYGHAGHLFQERFKSALMEKEAALLPAAAYLRRLPVEAGIVSEASAWRWSSLSAAIGAAEMTPEAWRMFDQQVCRGVVGSESFAELVRQRREAARPAARGTSSPERIVPARSTARPRWHVPSMSVAASVTVACCIIVAAAVYGRSAAARMARKLSNEQTVFVMVAPQGSAAVGNDSQAALASFAAAPRLSGTRWTIQVKPVNAAEGAIQQDALEFKSGRFTSEQMGGMGFQSSNYTLSSQNSTVVWETMQTNADREVVCWRGEINGSTMRGVVTRQRPGETPVEFSFIGTSPSGKDET